MRSKRTVHEMARLVGDGITGTPVWTLLHEHYLTLRARHQEFKAWLKRYFPEGIVDDEVILDCYFDQWDEMGTAGRMRDQYVVDASGQGDKESVRLVDDEDGLTLKQTQDIQKKWDMDLFYGDDES